MPLYDENGKIIGKMPKSQEPNFLQSIAGSFLNPLDRLSRKTLQFGANAGAGLRGSNGRKFQFLSDEEQEAYQNPLNIAKDVASAATSVIPFGGGLKALAASGALSGFGSSYNNDEASISSTLTGALTGGGLGLAGKGVSALANVGKGGTQNSFISNIGKKLKNAGDEQDYAQLQRNIGTKIPGKLTGQKLAVEIRRLGFDTSNADALIGSADTLLKKNGGVVGQKAKELAAQGAEIDVNEFLKPLQAQLAKKSTQTLKRPIEEAIEEIKQVGGKTGKLPLDKAYSLKQELGELGKFNPIAEAGAASKSAAFQSAYKKSNDILDDVFKKYGFNDFQALNKDVTAAIRAKNYGEIAAGRSMASRPINLLDAVTAAGGMTAGGPMGFAAGALASKVLQSPQAEGLLVKGLRGAGNLLDNAGTGGGKGLPENIQKRLQQFSSILSAPITAAAAGRLAGQAVGQTPPTPLTPPQAMNSATSGLSTSKQTNSAATRTQMFDELLPLVGQKGSPLKSLSDLEKYIDVQLGKEQELTADERKEKTKKTSALSALEQFEEQLGSIGGQENAMLARIFGSGSDVAGGVGLNEQAKVYNDLRMGLLPLIAKGTGDSGALTDSDISRAINLVPAIGDSIGERKSKFEKIRKLIGNQGGI